MKQLDRVVLSSSSSTITFSNISQDYDELYVQLSVRSTHTGLAYDPLLYRLNGTDTGYSSRQFGGDSSSYSGGESTRTSTVATGTWGRISFNGINTADTSANTFSNVVIRINRYRASAHKSLSYEMATPPIYSETGGSLWQNNAAVTTLSFALGLAQFAQHSTATLYGVRSSLSPLASGGYVSYLNGYWIHTFRNSGTFTPSANLTNVEYLVVAGGGGGAGAADANAGHGAGGAGGYRCSVPGESSGGGAPAESRISLTSGVAYTVTVGAGGARGAGAGNNNGTSGSDSVFGSITATGGGFGSATTNGGNGGSGGGARYGSTGGSPVTGQGYKGGNNVGQNSSFGGPGGGGAGAAAANIGDYTSNGSAGGIGVASAIDGTSTYRAGGGGGSGYTPTGGSGALGGLGGGGRGAGGADAVAGTVSTGGGGGSGQGGGYGGSQSFGAAGGSGIVIVRYRA